MTAEEAIERLSLLRIFDAPDLNDAVKMAVVALRAQADTPPNDPLTLEELREMDGEPVWVTPMRGSGGFSVWMLVDVECELCRETHGEMAVFENCGKTWTAYRRKPEEGTSVGS